MLVCQSVTKRFGALAAVEELSFEVEPGLVLGIGGPNGAGKTTLFDVVSGLQPLTSGKVTLDGIDISHASADRICHLGLARTFQLNAGFDSMTGRENVQVAAYFGHRNRLFPGLRLGKETQRRTEEALDLVGMRERAAEPVENAPILDRKLLMIAGAIVTEPKLLLMDEPVGGLTPREIDEVEAVVTRVVQEKKLTVILIEHVMRFLLRLSDRVLIMHHGSKLFEGLPEQVSDDKEVVEVYLGKGSKTESAPADEEKIATKSVAASGAPLLSVQDLASGYKGRDVLHGLSFEVPEGSLITLIGPNGHGKSTLLRTISGLLRPRGGDIRVGERSIAGLPTEAITALGIVQVPQGDMLFPEMTVRENLLMGAYLERDRSNIERRLDEVHAILPRLKERSNQMASTLSGGERRMVGIGRGLMAGGRLLMLDEPSLGLAPIIIDQIYEVVADLKASGRTILLVEENPMRIVDLAEEVHLLDNGHIVWSGSGQELSESSELLETYLGG